MPDTERPRRASTEAGCKKLSSIPPSPMRARPLSASGERKYNNYGGRRTKGDAPSWSRTSAQILGQPRFQEHRAIEQDPPSPLGPPAGRFRQLPVMPKPSPLLRATLPPWAFQHAFAEKTPQDDNFQDKFEVDHSVSDLCGPSLRDVAEDLARETSAQRRNDRPNRQRPASAGARPLERGDFPAIDAMLRRPASASPGGRQPTSMPKQERSQLLSHLADHVASLHRLLHHISSEETESLEGVAVTEVHRQSSGDVVTSNIAPQLPGALPPLPLTQNISDFGTNHSSRIDAADIGNKNVPAPQSARWQHPSTGSSVLDSPVQDANRNMHCNVAMVSAAATPISTALTPIKSTLASTLNPSPTPTPDLDPSPLTEITFSRNSGRPMGQQVETAAVTDIQARGWREQHLTTHQQTDDAILEDDKICCENEQFSEIDLTDELEIQSLVRTALTPIRLLSCDCCSSRTCCLYRCCRGIWGAFWIVVTAIAPLKLWCYIYCMTIGEDNTDISTICSPINAESSQGGQHAVAFGADGSGASGPTPIAEWRAIVAVALLLSLHFVLFTAWALFGPGEIVLGPKLVQHLHNTGACLRIATADPRGDPVFEAGLVRRSSCQAVLLAVLQAAISCAAVDSVMLIPSVRAAFGWLPPRLSELLFGASVAPSWIAWAAVGGGCVTASSHWLASAAATMLPLLLRQQGLQLRRWIDHCVSHRDYAGGNDSNCDGHDAVETWRLRVAYGQLRHVALEIVNFTPVASYRLAVFLVSGLSCAMIFCIRIDESEQKWSWKHPTAAWVAAASICVGGLILATFHGTLAVLDWTNWHKAHAQLMESANSLSLIAAQGNDRPGKSAEAGGGSGERLRFQLSLGHVDVRLLGIFATPGLVAGIIVAAAVLLLLMALLISF